MIETRDPSRLIKNKTFKQVKFDPQLADDVEI
jgi:hypothetical protein